jgi:hypothetical protein
VSDDELDDPKRRLRATRWPDKETVDDWSQGAPIAYVKDACRYLTEDQARRRPTGDYELCWARRTLMRT